MQWNMDHSRHNIEDVAAGYEALPKYDPKAEHAWQQLAAESKKHADYIRQHLNVTETDNPEPYDTSEDMIRDIRNNRNFVVSTANSEHPIWTPEQNVDFRIVHDVFGHAATEGDFGWHGENDACSTHFALSSPHAQKALATECLGQTGYAIHRGNFTDQKVGFIPGLHEGLAAANEDTPIPTQAQLMQRALYGPPKQSKWLISGKPKYDPKELEMGIQAEKEHKDTVGDDPKIWEQIAKDHLDEMPDYYTRLKKMEESGKKKSNWKIAESQDANRMYRQHTDGTPVAETTFESIQNKDTSDPYEDEYIIVDGKKWKKVRRKNNPQPDNYKDPIGGWGFYSKLLDKMEKQPWTIVSVEKANPIDVDNIDQYQIPRSYKIVDQLVPHFARYGVIPIVKKYSDTAEGYPLDELPKGGELNRDVDYTYNHTIHLYDPETQQIVYGMDYTLNHPDAFEHHSYYYPMETEGDRDFAEVKFGNHRYPTYVNSIHYNTPVTHKGVDDPYFGEGHRIYLTELDEKGVPRSLSMYGDTVDQFNKRYPRLSLSALRWMQNNLPKPIGADIINPKLREKAEKQDFVNLSKWKFSVPPAEKAEEYAKGYEKSEEPDPEYLQERYKWNPEVRGHRWKLNYENLEKAFNHPDFPVKGKYNVFTVDPKSAPTDDITMKHWKRTPLGTHEAASPNRAGSIHINPLISAESANEALWHELQHAYQDQEGRFTPEMRENYFDPTDIAGLSDEEVEQKFEENYLKHPMEIDANKFADLMRRYPLIEEADPIYKPRWINFALANKDVDEDMKSIIDKYYQEHGSKRRLPLPSVESKWKIAGETKTKLLERAAQLPEDTSEIVHTFDDGWTVRKLNTAGDMHREGELMGNCLSCNSLEGPYRSWYWNLPNGPNEDPEFWKEEFKNPNPAGLFYSLRDPDNLPHVTIGGMYDNIDILGKHNSEVKDRYKKYLNDFFTRDEYNEYKKYLDFPSKQSKWIKKEAPARSKAQFRYMQGICNGSIKPPEGMTRAQACEYVEGQKDYKDLPEKKSKLDMQQDLEKILMKQGFSEKGAILMALDYMSKLSYWIDGYHAAVALRDPESGDWHMDVGFSDKLTHGGVTADYINDLGTKAMRKAVADKDSRTDYYNHHTARGLYNPVTKDFIHMSHPDYWNEAEYNFEDLDQESRNKMEEFWRQLAEQNNIDLDSIRVLNNQTGHIEDLSVSDLEMPEEVQRTMRMKERERPLTPWERERGGYDTKTGSVKKAHWLKGYHAAVITPKGEMKIAKDWTQFHGSLLPDAATLADKNFHRGLYNKETGQLLHMTSPEEWDKLENSWNYKEEDPQKQWPIGFEWFSNPEHFISPYQTEKQWLKASENSGIPVSEVKFFSGEPEANPYTGFDVNKFNLHSPDDIARIRMSKWKTSKKDAWEAVLDGELGHDIITTGTWEEVKKQTIKWLKQLKNGYINKKNPHDNKKIDAEAKEQDAHALEDLKLYEEKKRWSFHFDHGKHPYDLIIQPVGYKESKWKKRSHWVEGFHAAGITPEGEMVVGPKWTTYHGELKTPNSVHKTFDPRAGWRGLYNPDTNELLHLTTPEEYGRFIYTETAENLEDFKNPHEFYRDAWQSAADRSNYPVESISLFVDKNNVNPAERNERGSFDLTKIGKWKVSEKKKNKIHPKFQTSLKDHKRSVLKHGPLKTHGVRNFKKKSVLNSEEGQALFEYEPYMYHDVAAARTKGELQDQIDTVRSILNNGILPKEQTGVSEYTDWLTSRPDHVYIGRKGFYPRTVPPAIRINMSKVDPSTLKPDEDIYHAFGFSDKHKDQIDMHGLKSAPFEEEHRNNPDYTLGQWMEDHSHLDTPKNVLASYLLNNSLAVHGGVPADALEINPEWVDHIKDRHGIDITKML